MNRFNLHIYHNLISSLNQDIMVEQTARTQCGNALNAEADLTGWPEFPAGTTSLVSKYLTKEVWDEYKDEKDAAGVSFKTCVFSGCKNVDSGIGVYAGSEAAYTQFNKLFDPLIEEYHDGFKPADKHVSNMNASELDCPALTGDDAAMIKSTRIRVGRNLADYPLGPGVTKAQRDEIMAKVVEACGKFEGDLAGKFYPLEGMSKEDQDQLIADHFLFK